MLDAVMFFESWIQLLQLAITTIMLTWLCNVSPLFRRFCIWTLLTLFTTMYTSIRNFDTILTLFLVVTACYVGFKASAAATVASQMVRQHLWPPQFGPERPDPAIHYDDGIRADKYWKTYDCSPGECAPLHETWDETWRYIKDFLVGRFMTHIEIIGLVIIYLSSLIFIVAMISIVYQWLRRRKNRVMRVVDDVADAFELTPLISERKQPMSEFVNSTGTKFQCDVLISVDGGPFVYSGQAFRLGQNLWTAYHVISDSSEVKLHTVVNDEDKYVIVKASDFHNVEGDVAVLKWSKNLNPLGMGAAKKFSGVELGTGAAFVEIHAMKKRTFGLLTQHQAFGFASYSGSTLKGFSGAPYVVGNIVCGMHIGHQGTNLGYDGAYLQMLSSKLDESSIDFLLDVMKRRGKKGFDFIQSPYDPDEYRVRYKGKYYVLDRSQLEELEEPAGYDDLDQADARGIYDYGTNKPRYREENALEDVMAPRDLMYTDSGNAYPAPARSNVDAGASGRLSRDQVYVPPRPMQKPYRTPESEYPSRSTSLDMDHPELMHVEQNAASNTMPNLVRLEEEVIRLEKIVRESQARLQYARRNLSQKGSKKPKSSRNSSKPSSPGGSQSPENKGTTSTGGSN